MIGANNTVTTYRMTTSGGKSTYSATPTLTAMPCFLVGADFRLANALGYANAFELFVMYMDQDVDILRGDKVVDRNDEEFYVVGIKETPDDEVEGTTEVFISKKFVGA